MSRTLLFECSPRRPADGVVVPLRLVFKCVGPATHLGVQWEPLVEAPPTFESAIGFDGRSLGTSPAPQVGELAFAVTDRTRAAAGLVWKNAVVTIKMALWGAGGARPADGDFATIWTGYADDIAVSNGRARVTMLDAGQLLRSAVIVTKFGSSGDALLDSADALKDRPAGTVVPQAWGKVLSIPGLLVDRANGIWLFANSAAASVQGFYDGGAAFTLGVARASLAALQANVPAAGAVDYCLNSAGKLLARPWSPPTYPFTAAATFGASNKIADIAAAIVSGRGGPAFKAGAVPAFNGVMAADAGLYLDDETTIAAALDRLFNGVGAWWKLTSAGTIDCRQLGFGTPVLTVPAHRRGAPERQRIVVPTARRSLGYARNDRVHSEGEIAAIILAGDLAYADGTLVETLKPADASATANRASDALQRNDSFEVWTAGGTPLGWASTGPGTIVQAAGSGAAVRGSTTASFTGANQLWGENISVAATEALWLAGGMRTTSNATSGPSLGSAGWRLGLAWSTLPMGPTGGGIVNATDLWNNAVPVSAGIVAAGPLRIAVPAGIKYAMLYALFENGLTSDAVSQLDYLVASRFGPAADATAQNAPGLTMPASPTIYADVAGAALVGQLPREIAAARTLGGVDVSGSTTWSIVASGCTASISSAGLITITACAATGRIEVTAVRDGLTHADEFSVTKVNAQPSVTGGSTANGSTAFDTTITSTASTSYGSANGGPLTVTAGPAGTVSLSAPLSFSGVGGAAGKWQWRIVGGSYADAGSEISSTSSAIVNEPDTGYIEVAQSVTGLTNGASYELQLLMRRVGGSGTIGFNGTAVAAGS